MTVNFNPYQEWLDLYLENQTPDYYQLLGLPRFESDGEAISVAASERMARLKVFATGPHSAESQQLLNEIARARVDLLDPTKKERYDAELRNRLDQALGRQEGIPTVIASGTADETDRVLVNEVRATNLTTKFRIARQKSAFRSRIAICISMIATVGISFYLVLNHPERPEDKHTPRRTQQVNTKSNETTSSVKRVGLQFTTLIESGQEWMYLDDGSNKGEKWRRRLFDDSKWKKGPSPLGYEDDQKVRHKTGVSFGNKKGQKYATTYFRKKFNTAALGVDARREISSLTLDLLRDDVAAVYLNGTEVNRDTHLTPGAEYQEYSEDNGGEAIFGDIYELLFVEIPIAPKLLIEGDNVLAIEVHQHKPGSSDLTLDARLVVTQRIDLKNNESRLAAYFDGSSHIQTKRKFDRPQPVTLEAYVLALDHIKGRTDTEKQDESLNRQLIVGNQSDSEGISLAIENRRWQFEFHSGNSPEIVRSKTPPIAGKWTHLAGVWDESEIRLYVDGVLHDRKPVSTHKLSRQPFVIGARFIDFTASSRFVGLIDEIRISSQVRYRGDLFEPKFIHSIGGVEVSLFRCSEKNGGGMIDVTQDHDNETWPEGVRFIDFAVENDKRFSLDHANLLSSRRDGI